MLGKLIKYEFKSTARTMVPLYLLLIGLGVVNGIGLSLNDIEIPSFIYFIFGILYFGVVITIMAYTFINIVNRFYKNLLSDEGYLMFTLPVKTYEIICSKLVIGVIWTISSSIIIGIATFAMIFIGNDLITEMFTSIKYLIGMLEFALSTNVYVLLWNAILLYIVSTIMGLSTIYLAIALGQMSNRHKVFASIGAYIVINSVLNLFSQILSTVFDKLGYTDKIIDYFYGYNQNLWMNFDPSLASLIVVAYMLILSFVILSGTCYIFKNKLNLE